MRVVVNSAQVQLKVVLKSTTVCVLIQARYFEHTGIKERCEIVQIAVPAASLE